MNRMPQPGEIYQHFKGNLYRIVTLAEHTESGEMLVVYQALYGSFQVYARPLAMFVGEVDHEKYPDVQAKQRFTLVPAAGTAMAARPSPEPMHGVTSDGKLVSGQDTAAIKTESDEKTGAENTKAQPDAERDAVSGNAEHEKTAEEEFELDPRLLAFLEADSYEKKLEVYASLDGKVDESILNTIAVSLDLELSGDTLEEQYDTLKNCLLMLEKYECNRLR